MTLGLVLAMDVDGPIADLSNEWNEWLSEKTGMPLYDLDNIEGPIHYDFGKYYQEGLEEVGVCSLDFWRQSDLYDNVTPVKGSVEVLKAITNRLHELVFVSHVKGHHHKSKVEFLKRHFPFMSGFIATKEKHFVRCDAIMDDRHENLNPVTGVRTVKIKYKTPFTQSVELRNKQEPVFEYCWSDGVDRLEELLMTRSG